MRGVGIPRECVVLHRTAELERELFGEVVSPSVVGHMDRCREDQLVYC